jgi:DNA polymerase III delta subunit
LDEVYENYLQHYDDEYNEEQKKIQKNPLHWMEMEYTNIRPYPKQMFIDKCKTDPEFSEKRGLKIEERELNVDELNIVNLLKQTSTKLITMTYNDKTIESYE